MNSKDGEKHFWNNYIAVLSEDRINPSLYTWYVRHCETFIKANKATRLKQHTKTSVSEYLSELFNDNAKKVWQIKQAIEAIRFLFKSIHAPLYLEIDWNYWESSCHELSKDHDTNYRSTHIIESQIRPPSSPLDQSRQDILSGEINRLRIALRRKNYTIRTEKAYTDWVQQFLRFSAGKNGCDIGQQDVISFLEYLAIQREVAPKTQSLALNAISFYFKAVLDREIGDISQFVRAKPREKLPVVLTQDEVSAILKELDGMQWLVVSLLYGSGLRIMEAIRLRVQDIDFGFNQIIVRNGKGNKERVVPLPAKVITPLNAHLSEEKNNTPMM